MEKSPLSQAKQALLQQRLKAASDTRLTQPEISRRPDPDSAPLSWAQHQMWVLDQTTPGNPAYNVPVGYRLRGLLDKAALENSFNAVIARHEMLRTTFAVKDGEPLQHIHPELKIRIATTNLSRLTGEEREHRLQTLASDESVRSFDLSCLPLIRVSLFRLDDDDHVLIINLHHIVADGLSVGVMLDELDTFYRAFISGSDPYLPELTVQFADFAQWQYEIGPSERAYTNQMDFWRKRLGGELPVLELPADRPRPSLQSFKGSNVFFTIPGALAQDLRRLSEREGCTLFMTLLAVFEVLLHRYSGSEDIVVGTPVAQRSPASLEPLIGDLINMIALRCDLSGDPAFIDLLRRTRDTTLDAFSNSDLPFEALTKHLTLERDPSRNPVFQVVMQLLAAPPPRIGDLEIISFQFDLKVAQFDLSLLLYQEGGAYLGRFAYCTDLFQAQTIQRLCEHYCTLLQAIVRDPERSISMLPMLTNAERHQVLEVWNQTTVSYPVARCVDQLVEEQAEVRPDALAAEQDGRQLRYRELNDRAERLAAQLQERGVRSGALVAVFLDRSLEMLVALLAIWKAGGAYVPIDPEYPADRTRFILEDTKAVAVLTRKSLSETLPAADVAVLHVDAEENRVGSSSSAFVRPAPKLPEQLAYVIYTSGSTGRPKGVPITHTSLFNLICWHQQAYQVKPADRATQIAGPAFDASVWEIWPYLTTGASVHIPDNATRLDPCQLVRWLTEQRITQTFLPTPLAESVLRESWPQSPLRVLLTGGDRLNQRPAQRLPFRVINHYGPTENTVVSTCAEVGEGHSQTAPPIGHPLPNTRAYVVDAHLQPVPIGVPGQLLVGGVQLTSGYLNRPELTAESFIPDLFGAQPGARLYKTGDLVRWLPDGNIAFLGRLDNQVKIRGFRIELGEIETMLDLHPAVRQSVVIVREEEPGRKQLVAYVVPEPGTLPDSAELRLHLKDRLPEFMLPSAVVLLDAFPLTPNGKIDREALPPPDMSAGLRAPFVAPQTPAEILLAEIWSQVLRLERCGVRDKFFELGGDSILSIQVIARARQAGLRLTVKQMFQYQTIAELALMAEPIATIAVEDGPVIGEVLFTPIQQWFLEQEFIDPHHWNQTLFLELKDEVEPALLEQAVRHLIVHHDVLRHRFFRHHDGWKQLSAAPDPNDETVSLNRFDLSRLSDDKQRDAMRNACAELQTQLDLTEGPLLRTALFNMGQMRPSRFLMVIHHLLVDAVSWRILLEDLQTACRQLQRGETVTLPPKSSSFKLWAHRLVEHAQSSALQGEIDYWLAAPTPDATTLPVDCAQALNCEASAQVVSRLLDAESTRALLQRVPLAYKTQINEVLLAALALVMCRWIGKPSVAIDIEGHGREELFDDVDLSRTVGWFTTVFPLQLDLRGTLGPGDVLKSVKEQVRQIPGRGIGYGLLRYLSGQARIAEQLQAIPHPRVAFNYLGQFDLPETSPFAWVWESAGPLHSPKAHRSHLLEINSWLAGDQLRADWTYSESVHRRSTIERLAEGFLEELNSLIRHCTLPEARGYTPSDFADAGLNQEELDRLISDLNSQHPA